MSYTFAAAGKKVKIFSGGNFIAYIICHMEKYQRSDIVGVERENERDETYRSKLNPQIEEFIMRYQMPDKLEFTSTAELRTYINYDSGKLKELGFTEAPKLELLTVDGNQLSELDLSNFPELKSLSCDYNNLTTLDLSANPKLEMVSLHNNPMLKEVWLKKGQVIDGINVNRDNYYKIDAHVEIKYKD